MIEYFHNGFFLIVLFSFNLIESFFTFLYHKGFGIIKIFGTIYGIERRNLYIVDCNTTLFYELSLIHISTVSGIKSIKQFGNSEVKSLQDLHAEIKDR